MSLSTIYPLQSPAAARRGCSGRSKMRCGQNDPFAAAASSLQWGAGWELFDLQAAAEV